MQLRTLDGIQCEHGDFATGSALIQGEPRIELDTALVQRSRSSPCNSWAAHTRLLVAGGSLDNAYIESVVDMV
jgi:hypothetical protein